MGEKGEKLGQSKQDVEATIVGRPHVEIWEKDKVHLERFHREKPISYPGML